ncbi:MAG TPA: hypothetical protein VKH82_00125 [Candidatus Binatia bacterium]|nr:hypothetical protein [Candidatus Binatia bacterium]
MSSERNDVAMVPKTVAGFETRSMLFWYRPVRMLVREGKHHGAVLCAMGNTVPYPASRSRLGVRGASVGVPVCVLRHSPAWP